jgi:hypothetical protein
VSDNDDNANERIAVMPNTYFARAGASIARHKSIPVLWVTPPRAMVLLSLGIGTALAACGSSQPLDQAIKCDQFKRSPDGSWTTSTDVSLDYTENGTQYQSNFGKGVTLTAATSGAQTAQIVAALEKKCNASK